MDSERIVVKNWKISDILKLSGISGLSSRLFRLAVDTFNGLDEFVKTKETEFQNFLQDSIFENKFKILADSADEQFDLCEKGNIRLISIWDDEYPILLRDITYPPLILFVKGSLQESDADSISIVGTRRCTSYGKLATEHFADVFAANNIIVTSGLAYGIDSLAHLSTIKSNGITYAVIASGIDEIMPAESQKTADKIIDSGGAIISEYKCGIKALPVFFPQRNRIISGISIATLVVESAEKGGSLITAKFAFDQGREVFAVPGSIFSEKSSGTNLLFSQNIAQPALSGKAMLQSLNLLNEDNSGFFDKNKNENLSEAEQAIMDNISHEPVHIDKIMELTGFDMSALLVRMLEMEFRGIVRQLPGKYYIRSVK